MKVIHDVRPVIRTLRPKLLRVRWLPRIGSSSLFTIIDDLAHWLRNFDEPVVGGRTVLEQLHRRGVLDGGDTIAYAYGLIFDENRAATVVHHGGIDPTGRVEAFTANSVRVRGLRFERLR